MARAASVRAADLQIYINGTLFGTATGIRWTADEGRHAIYGIDQYTPQELAPGAASIKGSIDTIRLHGAGGLESRGVTAPESIRLLEKYFTLAVIDRFNDSIVLAIDQCAVQNQSWQVGAKGELTGNFSFEGMEWENEA